MSSNLSTPRILHSSQDASVNFVFPHAEGSFMEARFVRREQDYFIIYLSSHNGCQKSCRFCHLTQTGQTDFNEANIEDFAKQSEAVFAYYKSIKDSQGVALRVNFNWMARGEALANSLMLKDSPAIFARLRDIIGDEPLGINFNLSTIMPEEVRDVDLAQAFPDAAVRFYYSLYSVNPEFRKRWIPKALEPQLALKKLADWQEKTGGDVALHWALIKGENDRQEDVDAVLSMVKESGLKTRFNLVRYNPFSSRQGEEPVEEVLQERFAEMATSMVAARSRIVPRVGFDVAASCGMFVS